MKVRIPKPPSEVQRLVDHGHAELQKLWLQFACILLNKNFNFTKEDCLLFLACWKEMYRINNTLKNKKAQSNYLNTELTRIFGEGGYPREYIDKLEELK